MKKYAAFAFFLLPYILLAQITQPAAKVNVFLGSSGDHGQLSPGAGSPFGLMSIAPETYPKLHMGYEYNAKIYLGFTHNRFEGVGCQGSGGNILIKPFIGEDPAACTLTKSNQSAGPGFYRVSFTNGITASMSVNGNIGSENYQFPEGKTKGFAIDLSHTLANRFVNEEHTVNGTILRGWIDSRTTCNAGTYRVYYAIKFDAGAVLLNDADHRITVSLPAGAKRSQVLVAFSAVDISYAEAALQSAKPDNFSLQTAARWNDALGTITVKGDPEREKLFYSLLYRTMQSPYLISEKDGSYRGTDGVLYTSTAEKYNGWAIWDNYRTQLPLMALLFPNKYQSMTSSIAEMYEHGKKDYATQHEPSNTVRTEHAGIVLLDAYRKGFHVDFNRILDSMLRNTDNLDFAKPDKALESSYDTWAMSQVLGLLGKQELSEKYGKKAMGYRDYWNKDFKDLSKPDIDKVSARGMYQGTIWQYRWLVPFDLKGLAEIAGGSKAYLQQLDTFFDKDYYNHANEPDIQAPLLYNATEEPWKSQALMHKIAADTMIQYYFNDNSRGIDPFIDRIYKNEPKALIRTMDDDAGANSAWYVFAACGFFPATIGWPVYYLNVPLFREVIIHPDGGKAFIIRVDNDGKDRKYIMSVTLNGKPLNRNWITHEEITAGGVMVITASDTPNKSWGTDNQFIPNLNMDVKRFMK